MQKVEDFLEVGKIYKVKSEPHGVRMLRLLDPEDAHIRVPLGGTLLFLGLLADLDGLEFDRKNWNDQKWSTGIDPVFLVGTELVLFDSTNYDRHPEEILTKP